MCEGVRGRGGGRGVTGEGRGWRGERDRGALGRSEVRRRRWRAARGRARREGEEGGGGGRAKVAINFSSRD